MAVKRKYSSKRKYGLKGRGDYSLNTPFGRYSYKGDTPFATVGKTIGSKFGYANIGEGVGHAVGRLFGSGDYKMGSTPSSNSIWNSTQTPKFAAKGRGNIITNREYVSDVFVGATAGTTNVIFDVASYTVNPGLASTFPWLATISQNYEQYKIHGMIFEFKSTLGDNSGVQNVGTVILGTEYNVNAVRFASKQIMENSEFAQSGKATESQIHGIECAGKEHPLKVLFMRTNTLSLPTGDSTKWYDFANFQIATTGFPNALANQNIGELWVSYQIEFFKPQIPSNIGGAVQTAMQQRSGTTAGNWLGTASVGTNPGTLALTFTGTNQVDIAGLYVGNSYVLSFAWTGTAAAVTNMGFSVQTGFTAINAFQNRTASTRFASTAGGALSTSCQFEYAVRATSTSIRLTFNSGTFPAGNVDVSVYPLDNAISP